MFLLCAASLCTLGQKKAALWSPTFQDEEFQVSGRGVRLGEATSGSRDPTEPHRPRAGAVPAPPALARPLWLWESGNQGIPERFRFLKTGAENPSSPTPAMGRDAFLYLRGLQAPSSLAWALPGIQGSPSCWKPRAEVTVRAATKITSATNPTDSQKGIQRA